MQGGDKVLHDPEHAFTGQASAQLVTDLSDTSVYHGIRLSRPRQADARTYFRFYYFVPADAGDNDIVEVKNIDGYYAAILQQRAGNLALGAAYLPITYSTSSRLLARDRWNCIEWMIDDTGTGEMRVWLEGTEVVDLARTGFLEVADSFDRFSLKSEAGYLAAPQASSDERGYDEVVFDDKPIGCL